MVNNGADWSVTGWKTEDRRTGVKVFLALAVLISSALITIPIGGDRDPDAPYPYFPVLVGLYGIFETARLARTGRETITVDLNSRRLYLERTGLFRGQLLEKLEVPLREIAHLEIREIWPQNGYEGGACGYELVARLKSGRAAIIFTAPACKDGTRSVEAHCECLERYLDQPG